MNFIDKIEEDNLTHRNDLEKKDFANNNNKELNGKEKQELGRLRTEKVKMDLTVKAAITVGMLVQQKFDKKEKIIKKEISDLIYKIDKNIPSTRIDFIWQSISEEYKKGAGRPPKKV